MPNYSFVCDGCNHEFDEILPMKDSDLPLKKPCPKCKKNKIAKNWGQYKTGIAYDTTLTPSKLHGSAWEEVMAKVKKAAPRSMQDRLEQTRTMNGGRYVR